MLATDERLKDYNRAKAPQLKPQTNDQQPLTSHCLLPTAYFLLFYMPAFVAGEFIAVIGVYDHHAVTFWHFAREFARHHFSISLFFFHNNLNIEIQGPARPRQYLFFGYGKRKDSQAISS